MEYPQSYWEMFVVQAFLHSMVTVLIVESAVVVLDLRSHLERFRIRLLIMFLPLGMFPLFQILSPDRGRFYFRHDEALFDSLRWFQMEIGGVPVAAGLVGGVMLITSLITLFQEIIPFLKSIREKGETPHSWSGKGDIDDVISELAVALGVPAPRVRIINDDQPVVYTVGARRPTVVLSSGLIERLGREHLISALAHELSHIRRQSNATTFLVYMARLLMFFSPVSLLVFRRIIQDDEHICDDITASLTGRPEQLAATLRAFATNLPPKHESIGEVREALGDHSHNLLLLERIRRLEEGDIAADIRFRPLQYAATLCAVIMVNYYVV